MAPRSAPSVFRQVLNSPPRRKTPVPPAPSKEEGPWASIRLQLSCYPSAEPVPFHSSLRQGLTSPPVKQRVSAVSLPKVPKASILRPTCQPSEVQTIPQSQCSFGTHVCCSLRDTSPSWRFTHLLWRSESQRPPVTQAGIGHRQGPLFAFPAGSFFLPLSSPLTFILPSLSLSGCVRVSWFSSELPGHKDRMCLSL